MATKEKLTSQVKVSEKKLANLISTNPTADPKAAETSHQKLNAQLQSIKNYVALMSSRKYTHDLHTRYSKSMERRRSSILSTMTHAKHSLGLVQSKLKVVAAESKYAMPTLDEKGQSNPSQDHQETHAIERLLDKDDAKTYRALVDSHTEKKELSTEAPQLNESSPSIKKG